MNKMHIRYFEQEDVLHLVITDEPEARSLELSPTITVELNAQNEVIGVEILNASTFLRDSVLDSIQAKTLQLLAAEPA
ncbi:MAG: DNA polymerase III subunit alpha [Chloroflexi bacterium]|nr:MAG: DNA polymerase III subunit alpha [Chloroflexota bacterium]